MLTCIAQMLCMPGFTAYSALLPRLRDEWALSNGEAGLISGVLFLGYAISVPALAILTDREDARRIYVASALIAASGLLGLALFATGLASAAVAQAVFGIGFAGLYMPGLKALSDRIEPSAYGQAATLYTSLSGVGIAFAYAVTAGIAETAGWRIAIGIDAVGPLAAAAIVLLCMRPKPPPARLQRLKLLQALRAVLSNRPALGYIVGYVTHSWELFGFRAWMVAFLAFALSRHGVVDLPKASLLAAIVSLIGSFSNFTMGRFIERLGRSRLTCLVMAVSVVSGIAAGLSWMLPIWSALLLMGLYYAAIMADSGALAGGIIAATPGALRGIALGVYSTSGFAAALVAPTVFGLTIDVGGSGNGLGWAAGFLMLCAPNLAGIVVVQRLAGSPSRAAEEWSAPT